MARIRNQAAFDRAAEKRARQDAKTIERIAGRIPSIIDGENYRLEGDCESNVLLKLNALGAKLPEKGSRGDAPRLIAAGLALALEHGTVSRTIGEYGQVIYATEPPMAVLGIEEIWEHSLGLLQPRHYRLAYAWGFC